MTRGTTVDDLRREIGRLEDFAGLLPTRVERPWYLTDSVLAGITQPPGGRAKPQGVEDGRLRAAG
ncbi:hypothetical protein DQP56_09670 [Mycolicibacter senuensis]|nr:hypothetical protein DQP56_09670 [Mycolicibacter senuensis]